MTLCSGAQGGGRGWANGRRQIAATGKWRQPASAGRRRRRRSVAAMQGAQRLKVAHLHCTDEARRAGTGWEGRQAPPGFRAGCGVVAGSLPRWQTAAALVHTTQSAPESQYTPPPACGGCWRCMGSASHGRGPGRIKHCRGGPDIKSRAVPRPQPSSPQSTPAPLSPSPARRAHGSTAARPTDRSWRQPHWFCRSQTSAPLAL